MDDHGPTRVGESHVPDEADELRRLLFALLPAFAFSTQALAQDAAKVQPGAYRVALENDRLRVLDFHSRPGLGVCGVGMHSHPAHLTVALSAGKARIKTPDGKEVIGENKLGDTFWSEAETHEVENISGKDMRALIIELKTMPGRNSNTKV
ncbi:hypothetical protein BH11PSE13_BH11PSE13_29740 [soil metagenome]